MDRVPTGTSANLLTQDGDGNGRDQGQSLPPEAEIAVRTVHILILNAAAVVEVAVAVAGEVPAEGWLSVAIRLPDREFGEAGLPRLNPAITEPVEHLYSKQL